MSGTRGQIEIFFRTLLLGDFAEEQSTSAQVVGGLISMVPVLDQVMDARDITGSLFRINQQGGFDHATSDQLVTLGFAAFGAVPFVGSAFKTVFRPLWKERHAAKGAVNGGLEAVEGLLGLGKGGAVRWVRVELIAKWPSRTNAAIAQVEAALAASIELTEFIANAKGWRDWLLPDSVQELARHLLPSLKELQGQIRAPLQRASDEILAFLEDILGEQAAAVVMGVGQRAAAGSANPGSRSRSGNNRADVVQRGQTPPREGRHTTGNSDTTHRHRNSGSVHAGAQRTRRIIENLANQEKGLVGEHIVDYAEMARLGGQWQHDDSQGSWSGNVQKINCDKRPVNLSLADLPKVNQAGIDAVWQHGASYTATEAKARASVGSAYGIGQALTRQGKLPKLNGLNPDRELLHFLLSDSSDKKGTQPPMMQMSKEWVKDRAKIEKLPREAQNALENDQSDRRVVLVTFESSGALDHVQALMDIHAGKTGADILAHEDHGTTRAWGISDIDAVANARKAARRAATGAHGQASSTTGSSSTTGRTRSSRGK